MGLRAGPGGRAPIAADAGGRQPRSNVGLRRPGRDSLPAVFCQAARDVLSFFASRPRFSDAQLRAFARAVERAGPVLGLASRASPPPGDRLFAPACVYVRPSRPGEPISAPRLAARPAGWFAPCVGP